MWLLTQLLIALSTMLKMFLHAERKIPACLLAPSMSQSLQKTHSAIDLGMFITFTSYSMWVFWCLIRYEHLVQFFSLQRHLQMVFRIKFHQDGFILVSDLILNRTTES